MSSAARTILALLCLAMLGMALTGCRNSESDADRPRQRTIIIFASLELEPLLRELQTPYEVEHPDRRLLVQAEGWRSLAQQINDGSTLDLFIPAENGWAETIGPQPIEARPWLRDGLLVVAPIGSDATEATLGNRDARVAMAPDTTQTGRLARLALLLREQWAQVETRLYRTTSEAGVVAALRAGEADIGVAYSTAIAGQSDIRAVAELDLPENVEVAFPLAAFSDVGMEFANWLQTSQRARDTAERLGFLPAE